KYRINLAELLAQAGRQEEAAAIRRAVVALMEKRAAAILGDPRSKEKLSEDLVDWVILLRGAGDFPGAEKLLRVAQEWGRKQVAEAPTVASRRFRLAQHHGNLGTILQRARRLPEAADQFRQSLALYEGLAAEFPQEFVYGYWQANAANFLGIALRGLP